MLLFITHRRERLDTHNCVWLRTARRGTANKRSISGNEEEVAEENEERGWRIREQDTNYEGNSER